MAAELTASARRNDRPTPVPTSAVLPVALPSSRALEGVLLGGRYRLMQRIGEGGMGAVYEAFQEDLRRTVAVKVIAQPVTEEGLRRFHREARAAAALHHPHIVQVFDFHLGGPDRSPEQPYLVMERLEGPSLRELVREGPLPERRVARIGAQILGALGAAHRAGVIHRDLKPGNIVVCSGEGEGDHAKLVDFGAAKLLSGSKAGSLGAITSTGTLIGTLSYMSPEQAQVLELDGRADVYAAAVCMYTACVGRNPFVRETPDETVKAILGGRFAPLAKTRPDLDPAFCAIVEQGMARQRDARFQSAEAMAEALEAWLAGATTARVVRAPDASSSGRLALLVVAGVFLGGLAAAALLGSFSGERALRGAPKGAALPASAAAEPP